MDREEKLKALDAALTQIEKAYGKGSVMKLGDSSANMNIETVPTGSLSLDIALGLGAVLAHAYAVAVASAPYGEGPKAAFLVSGCLVYGNVSAGHTAPASLGFPIVFPIYQGFVSQNTSDLALAADDFLPLTSVDFKLFGDSAGSPLCHEDCLNLSNAAHLFLQIPVCKLGLPPVHREGRIVGFHLLILDKCLKGIIILQFLHNGSVIHQGYSLQIRNSALIRSPYRSVCGMAAGGGKIVGLSCLIPVKHHLAAGFLHRRVRPLTGCTPDNWCCHPHERRTGCKRWP